MKRLRSIYKKLKLAALATACWLAIYAPVLAGAKAEEEGEEKGGWWVLSYGLVLLGVALGMLVVCRSSRRRDQASKEMFSDSDEAQEDQ